MRQYSRKKVTVLDHEAINSGTLDEHIIYNKDVDENIVGDDEELVDLVIDEDEYEPTFEEELNEAVQDNLFMIDSEEYN